MKTDSERIAVIETTVLEMKAQLLGSDRGPGQIEILHTRINETNKRVSHLESWKWWVSGMAFGIGTLIGWGLR